MPSEFDDIFKRPFDEQIDFFRKKMNLTSAQFDRLKKATYDNAFTIAGTYKIDVVVDFRDAIGKAILKGTTLETFRKDFDNIVEKHGWDYNGSRNWRSQIIYSQNIRASYSAGRWEQLHDPEQLEIMPYITWKHSPSLNPREEHEALDGMTLPANDPFWTEYGIPPNGWYGCKCRLEGATQRDYEASPK